MYISLMFSLASLVTTPFTCAVAVFWLVIVLTLHLDCAHLSIHVVSGHSHVQLA